MEGMTSLQSGLTSAGIALLCLGGAIDLYLLGAWVWSRRDDADHDSARPQKSLEGGASRDGVGSGGGGGGGGSGETGGPIKAGLGSGRTPADTSGGDLAVNVGGQGTGSGPAEDYGRRPGAGLRINTGAEPGAIAINQVPAYWKHMMEISTPTSCCESWFEVEEGLCLCRRAVPSLRARLTAPTSSLTTTQQTNLCTRR